MVDFSVAVSSEQNQICMAGPNRVSVRKADPTHKTYTGRKTYEEAVSNFYPHVQRDLSPELILDIGANQGVIAVIAGVAMPGAHVVCIEPIPELYPYIEYNLYSNKIGSYEIITGIVGETIAADKTFHLNPNGSADSRVVAPADDWEEIPCTQTTIDELLKDYDPDKGLYIKTDTQGYEPFVMRGGEKSLAQRSNWLMKSEFAPRWIEDQQEDPVAFLAYLLERYDVTEFSRDYVFGSDYRELITRRKLKPGQEQAFVDYVAEQFRDRLGWVDLLITPKPGI